MVKGLFIGQVCHHFSVVLVASKLPQSTYTFQVKETFKCWLFLKLYAQNLSKGLLVKWLTSNSFYFSDLPFLQTSSW